MAKGMKNPTKVVTGRHTVFSYLNVNEPKTPMGGGTPKYSVSLIIPKSDTVTIAKIRAAIQAAYDEGQSKLKGNSKYVPALEDLKTPLRDGDKERKGDEAYKNAYFVNANSTTKPGVVDADCQPILDTSELNNLQKLSDGTPLGGHSRAEDDFADLEDEDDEDFLS